MAPSKAPRKHIFPTESRLQPKVSIQGSYDRSETSFGSSTTNRIQIRPSSTQDKHFLQLFGNQSSKKQGKSSDITIKLDPETPIKIVISFPESHSVLSLAGWKADSDPHLNIAIALQSDKHNLSPINSVKKLLAVLHRHRFVAFLGGKSQFWIEDT